MFWLQILHVGNWYCAAKYQVVQNTMHEWYLQLSYDRINNIHGTGMIFYQSWCTLSACITMLICWDTQTFIFLPCPRYLQVAKGQWNTLTWLQGSVLLSWVGNPFWCTLHTLFLSSLFSLHCWTSLSNYSNILVHPLSCWFNLPEEYNPNYSLLTSETHCLLLHIPCPWLRGSHIFKCLSESDLFWALMAFYF